MPNYMCNIIILNFYYHLVFKTLPYLKRVKICNNPIGPW